MISGDRIDLVVQYAASEQLVGKANNLLTWAMGDGVTQAQVAAAMLQWYLGKECRRGYDITADFIVDVIAEMSKELQVTVARDKYREALQRYRESLKEAQEEVTRRRKSIFCFCKNK